MTRRSPALLAAAALQAVSADHRLMKRVLEEQAVAQALPAPSWTEYLLHLVRTAVEKLLAPFLGALPMAGVARWLLVGLAALATLVTIGLVVRALRRRREGTVLAGDPATTAAPVAVDRAADPAAWRRRLEEHLGRGDIAEALDALWWWLATSVAREPVDPSWTTRELLARAGRSDLRGFSIALDRLAYAAARPQTGDVRAFLDRLQAAL
jgi:hypothetical protein